MFPTPVAVALSVVFLATGVIGASALARGARTGAPGGCGDTRTTELLHVVMSLAMIAMAWGWTGGPETVGGAAQVVLFTLAVVTLVAVGVRDTRRGLRREARRARLSHGLMAAATVWMVAAMPLLMAAGVRTAPGPAPTAGMAGMPGMAHGGHAAMPAAGAPAAGWVPAASTVLVLVLVVVGVAWSVRAVQLGSPAHRALVPAPRRAPDDAVVRALAPAGGALPTAAEAPQPEGQREPSAPVGATPAPRPAAVAAACHALMCLGMAGMLAAML